MKTKKQWKVLANTYCEGWSDCWTEDDKPQRFDSKEEAQAAIDELIADVKDAVACGDMDEEYDPKDYKIVRA